MRVTGATDETDNMPPFRVGIFDRLDTLSGAIATANRASIAHAEELRKLRRVLIIGVIAILFYIHTRGLT